MGALVFTVAHVLIYPKVALAVVKTAVGIGVGLTIGHIIGE